MRIPDSVKSALDYLAQMQVAERNDDAFLAVGMCFRLWGTPSLFSTFGLSRQVAMSPTVKTAGRAGTALTKKTRIIGQSPGWPTAWDGGNTGIPTRT